MSDAPPGHVGPIRTIEQLRAYLERQLWARNRAAEIMAKIEGEQFRRMRSYSNGKASALMDILDRINWPDACEVCGGTPVVGTSMEGKAQCNACDDAELDKMIEDDEGNEA